MLQLCQGRFAATGTDPVKIFLSCLDYQSRSPDAGWLRGLKNNFIRKAFERAKVNGEEMDQSATPIHLMHVRDIIRCYALVEDAEVRAAEKPSAASLPRPPARFTAHMPRLRAGRIAHVRLAGNVDHRRALGRGVLDARRRSELGPAAAVHCRRGAPDQGIQDQAVRMATRR